MWLSRLMKKVLKRKNVMLYSLSSTQHSKSCGVRQEATRSALCSDAGFATIRRL